MSATILEQDGRPARMYQPESGACKSCAEAETLSESGGWISPGFIGAHPAQWWGPFFAGLMLGWFISTR